MSPAILREQTGRGTDPSGSANVTLRPPQIGSLKNEQAVMRTEEIILFYDVCGAGYFRPSTSCISYIPAGRVASHLAARTAP